MPLAVPLLAAGVGAAGSLYASSQANKTAKKQIEAQTQLANQQTALQQQAFEQQQAYLAPYLQAGYGALSSLQQQLGIGGESAATGAAKPAGGNAGTLPTASSGGGQDWGDYLNRYTDVAAEYQRLQSTPQGQAQLAATGVSTPEQFAQYHATQVAPSLGENRTVNQLPATQTQAAAPTTYGPAEATAARETYTRPDQGAAPAMPDLSAAAYQQSPGFQTGLQAGQRNLNANYAARGLLGSGAGAEAAIKFGTDYQNQDYNAWRNNQLAIYQQQLQQYNTDRANTNSNFNSDRGYGTGVFDADRGYATDRFDTKTNNLLSLVSAGNPSQANGLLQTNANNQSGILQNSANNLSNIYGQQGQNNVGLAGSLVGFGQGLLSNLGGGTAANSQSKIAPFGYNFNNGAIS